MGLKVEAACWTTAEPVAPELRRSSERQNLSAAGSRVFTELRVEMNRLDSISFPVGLGQTVSPDHFLFK